MPSSMWIGHIPRQQEVVEITKEHHTLLDKPNMTALEEMEAMQAEPWPIGGFGG